MTMDQQQIQAKTKNSVENKVPGQFKPSAFL